MHIDRQLPFLCIYRKPPARDDAGTEKLLFGEAAYITASGARYLHRSLRSLIQRIASTQVEIFGGVLIIEIWSNSQYESVADSGIADHRPAFRIHAQKDQAAVATVERLERSLKAIRIMKLEADVEVVTGTRPGPPVRKRLFSASELKELGAHYLGLEVRPVYRDAETGETYPLILRSLHRGLARAFKQAFFEFARSQTVHSPPHYLAMGRRAMVKAVWEADSRLAEVSNAFDLLLYLTPTNSDSAYAEFKRSGFDRQPTFVYRPRPVDPALLKRSLYSIPLERIEDPSLAHVFRETREDLDHRITLISDRNRPRFLYSSLRVFGGVTDSLLDSALALLNQIPARSREAPAGGYLDADAFARRVSDEIEYYRNLYPDFAAAAEVRKDIVGLLSSRGKLLIGHQTKIAKSRADALIQHEVGTHLLTYYNGRAQPFKQLYLGLAGYDELQEGLAVLAEYFAGGLSRPRMRLLAARVVAVRRLVEGASFVETFRDLAQTHGIALRTAFVITMRVYRGGGLTKDAVYLKGLKRLLRYMSNGSEIRDLFLGKYNTSHIPFVKELLWRNILHSPNLTPRYLDYEGANDKLSDLRRGLSPLDLIRRRTRRSERK